jgi:hypothetical protein
MFVAPPPARRCSLFVAVAMLAAAPACSPDDGGGTGSCDPALCTATCTGAGYLGGTCVGLSCSCTGGGDADADADADADGDADADDTVVPDDAEPGPTVCRYECPNDDVCRSVYGAGWVCRDVTVTTTYRACQRLCTVDDDCRYGVASDPLMVCRSGTCAMRACAAAGECGWVGAGAECATLDWGTLRTCKKSCGSDADCGSGVPSDVMYHCDAGLCEWYCTSDDDCFAGFGTRDYGCRSATGEPGPTCVRGCGTTADCLLGGPTDEMAVCR